MQHIATRCLVFGVCMFNHTKSHNLSEPVAWANTAGTWSAPECPYGTIESDQGVAPKDKELLNISDFNSVYIKYGQYGVPLLCPRGKWNF